MRDIYHVLHQNDFASYPDEVLNDYVDQCASASTAIKSALTVIGNLTFEASMSEDYSDAESKRDLLLIGCVLRFLPRLAQVLSDNSGNAEFEQRKRKGCAK
ncbi:hypothetical protein [Salmonella enterica]|uniref:hypothetical protein n=1 Tax=Salmonella enterica TaxID=28901 RepID=UPI00234D84FD|nr:hypothetical protein [Salmonella enterica]HCZ5347223.1 hypothetical protein [Salmonella enterica]